MHKNTAEKYPAKKMMNKRWSIDLKLENKTNSTLETLIYVG
jgi:hypothetical protein